MDFSILDASAGDHYVETGPGICDFNHGLGTARAVTIQRRVVPRQDTDQSWLTLQGMKR
jgi:hypothetical protein